MRSTPVSRRGPASPGTLRIAILAAFVLGAAGLVLFLAGAMDADVPFKPAMEIRTGAAARSPTLLFCDEFDRLGIPTAGGGAWDASYFWQGKPNGSTLPGEQQWYVDPAFPPTQAVRTLAVADGVLNIIADRTPPAITAHAEGHPYVSGMLTTGRGFAHMFGYFELRAKLPRGQGLWPAFWLVPRDMTASHEIDVMEVLGQDMRKLHTTFHIFTGGHRYWEGDSRVPDMADGYHLFGVDWQADKITWYFDRRPVYQRDTPAELHKPMFMILNLAAGGPMPGPVGADTSFPARMLVDYVRVYGSVPRAPASSLPLVGAAHCPAGRG